MSVGIEGLFTSALGLVAPWEVGKVELDTARRRIDFEVRCQALALACPPARACCLSRNKTVLACFKRAPRLD